MGEERKTCNNCGRWMGNHCAVYSCGCATQVLNHEEPHYWISISNGLRRFTESFRKEEQKNGTGIG
jgi:hypothetical protein